MSVWGGVAVILAALSAIDWLRRRGFSFNRYPATRRVTSKAVRIGRLVLAVMLGIMLAAALINLAGLGG